MRTTREHVVLRPCANGAGSAKPSLDKPPFGRTQRGTFAVLSVPLLLVFIGFCGLALDMGQLYNRKVDLSGFARAVALAAAHELNGTAAGITAARTRARETAETLHYKYFESGISFIWTDAALSFGSTSSRSDNWTDGSSPAGLYFAKVDTSALAPTIGTVNTFFARILSSTLSAIKINESVIAGRTSINITPIAICAMDNSAATERTNSGASSTELVQYGFRRGISYDLMQLNPNGTLPANYLINPVIAPGVYSSVFDTSLIGSFVCTGNMWVPTLTGGSIRVSPLASSSPLQNLYIQLNSRFDDFTGNWCNPNGAPPDYNDKPYPYDTAGGVSWMTPTTGNASAATTTSRNKLETVADLPTPPNGITAGSYGPLWSFAKAVKYSSYLAYGTPEPASGYSPFATTDWPSLYKSGPTASGYQTIPYQSTSGSNYRAPSSANLEVSTQQRRVLNIPLLTCPVNAGSNVAATVKAVGKFFMTVPATKDTLIAEFAGVITEQELASEVDIFP